MMMRLNEIKAYLIDNGYNDTVILENPNYETAIIGISHNGQLIYSYNQMVECLENNENMTEDEAIEFIDYNTIRSLPYMGDKQPIICMTLC